MTSSHRHAPIQRNQSSQRKYAPLTPLDFSEINQRTQIFADHIEAHFEELAQILLTYESFEVVQDETARTLDLLRNLRENKKYFRLRVGAVTSFLPRNQPLYALTCFVIVPSLMASEVHFRIPHSMREFFPKLLTALDIHRWFPNIVISHKERLEFLRERSALWINPKTQESWPVTDAVIFTGTSNHADRLRLVFDHRTLFIANGAGHNPIVVSEDANIPKAVEATLMLQLYNQGQDCAAPNAILVHKKIYPAFLRLLEEGLRAVRVGHYNERSCRVGPISEPEDLVRIQSFLIEHRAWLNPSTAGVIRASDAILEPTIICKPLKESGNFTEVFAPIIFLQQYEGDSDLALYFENPHYARNAMYISLYGTSEYIKDLIGRPIGGKVLHESGSVLQNTHLHEKGVERGTQPYGGCGHNASSLSINDNIICKATLPQRDIYDWIAKPLLRGKTRDRHKAILRQVTKIQQKDVQKLLGLKALTRQENSAESSAGISYVDSHAIKGEGRRYIRVGTEYTFHLLDKPNIEHIASLEPKDLQLIRTLRAFLQHQPDVPIDEFTSWLYALAKKPRASERENRAGQLRFFNHVYQLLLGKESGPRLAHFLLDTDRQQVLKLLDV